MSKLGVSPKTLLTEYYSGDQIMDDEVDCTYAGMGIRNAQESLV
jgi:hypothetical protein